MSETSHKNTAPEGAWAQSARISFAFLYVVVILLAAGWLFSNWTQVPPESRAVVLRMGIVNRLQDSGLLMAWPSPFEEVVLLPSEHQQISYRIRQFDDNFGPEIESKDLAPSLTTASASSASISYNPRMNAAFLLTGDSSVVHMQAVIYYQITDPVAYVIAADHVRPALERLFVSSAIAVSASRDLDSILVARPEMASDDQARIGREQLRSDMVDAVNARLLQFDSSGSGFGITVSRVDLLASIPLAAKSAFDFVLVVTQNADTSIAQARTDAVTTQQRAIQQRDRTLTDAQAAAEERITRARTSTAAIAALSDIPEGQSAQVVLNRLYFDRVRSVLKDAGRVDAVDGENSVRLILPGFEMP